MSLYNEKYQRFEENIAYIKENLREENMPIIENKYGTTIFSSEIMNKTNDLHYFSTSKYIVINLMFLENIDYENIISTIKEKLNNE